MADQHELKQKINQLRSEKAALQVQSRLLENFVTFARSSTHDRVMTRLLQKTLEISAELTAADKGSLFLLDADGAVVDGILTRVDPTPEQRSRIIGQVFEEGLAGWVRRHRKVGLIDDTEEDDRWVDLPNQPYTVGSALAVPILKGHDILGIVTLLHEDPGHFKQDAADLMQITANQIGAALENARLYSKLKESYRSLERAKAEIEAYSKALDNEMAKGKKIQRDFLPRHIPQIPGWDIAIYFHPARQVSGDFYDAFRLQENLLGIVIADVCDKGVGSALFMALFRSLIRVFSGHTNLQGVSVPGSTRAESDSQEYFLEEALNAVALTNDYIAEEHGEEGMFATLFFGVLDPTTGRLAYINGGHEPLFVINSSGIKARLAPTGPAVGVMPDSRFNVQQINLEPGDVLVGYTDGVTEARSPGDEAFSRKRLQTLLEQPFTTASDVLEHVKSDLFSFIDIAPRHDDVTMLAVQHATV